jgi:hypothetical protein
MMAMKQKRWTWRGWHFMATWNHGWGLGCYSTRYNGVDFFLGPLTLGFQPPPPKWLGLDILSRQAKPPKGKT